jgi:hypothetical protein
LKNGIILLIFHCRGVLPSAAHFSNINLSPNIIYSQTTCLRKMASISFLISKVVNFSELSIMVLDIVSILKESLFFLVLTSQLLHFVIEAFAN